MPPCPAVLPCGWKTARSGSGDGGLSHAPTLMAVSCPVHCKISSLLLHSGQEQNSGRNVLTSLRQGLPYSGWPARIAADGCAMVRRHSYGENILLALCCASGQGLAHRRQRPLLAAARIRVNTPTDPLLLPIVCQLALVGRKDSSQPPTSTAECGWVADPNQRWPSAPAFGG